MVNATEILAKTVEHRAHNIVVVDVVVVVCGIVPISVVAIVQKSGWY